jgi:hypothetical protein
MSIIRDYNGKTSSICCDICGGKIGKKTWYWELVTYIHVPEEDDYDNYGDCGCGDGCENYEEFDICSEVCLREKFDEYARESATNNDDIMCFELNRACLEDIIVP